MEAEGSLPCSQESISAPSTELDEVSLERHVNISCKVLSHKAHTASRPSGEPASAAHLLRLSRNLNLDVHLYQKWEGIFQSELSLKLIPWKVVCVVALNIHLLNLKTFLFLSYFTLAIAVAVVALRWADPPSKESCRLS
jgi:hypothetical protein